MKNKHYRVPTVSVDSDVSLDEFRDEDIAEYMKHHGHEVTLKKETPSGTGAHGVLSSECLEREADRLFRQHENLPRDVQRFLANIIGAVA